MQPLAMGLTMMVGLASAVLAVVEVGDMLDGAGLGLLGPHTVMLAPGIGMVCGGIGAVLFGWRKSASGQVGTAFLIALVGTFLYLAIGGPWRVFAWRWSARCEGGETAACSGAAQLVRQDRERALGLLRRGCGLGAIRVCNDLLWLTPDDPAACGIAAAQCSDPEANADQREIPCRVLVRGCLPNLARPARR